MDVVNSHPLLINWLINTTCHDYRIKRSVLFENDGFIVLKHPSHTSYCGRMYGSKCCNSYAKLYRKSDLMDQSIHNRTLRSGDGELKQWDGRISKKRIVDDCHEMGIEFANTHTVVAAV